MNDKDAVIQVKTLKSLMFFTKYHFKKRFNRKFIENDHHKIIVDALEKVLNGEITRLIINIAPRYGKTELAVKNFIAHGLALNPSAKFIHISYSDSLALDNSEEIKDLVLSDEYQRLYPAVKIKKDSKAKEKWYTTEGGGVLARSSSSSITGFGAGTVDEEIDEFLNIETDKTTFGGAIVMDDPLKASEADSSVVREKVNNKFETTIRNRVNSRKTPIIIIMQRLHSSDLCGYLTEIEPGAWHVISLPAIKEDGTALWSFKHTIEELHKLRKINEFVFDTQYMQNPKPKEGLLFAKDDLNYYDSNDLKTDQTDGKLAFIDVADTGTDAHAVPIGYLIGTKIYIHDILYTTKGTDENVELTAEILNKHLPEYCRVESNFGGGMYVQLLQPKLNKMIGLLPIRATTNKHSRITQMAGFIKENCYFRTDYEHGSDYYHFMKNLTEYLKNGKVEHDDAPDSLEGLCSMIKSFHADLYS